MKVRSRFKFKSQPNQHGLKDPAIMRTEGHKDRAMRIKELFNVNIFIFSLETLSKKSTLPPIAPFSGHNTN